MFFVGDYGNAKLTCKNCNRSYKNFNTLRSHTKLDCGKEKQFQCNLCKFSSKRRYAVKNHFLTVHNKSHLIKDLRKLSFKYLKN